MIGKSKFLLVVLFSGVVVAAVLLVVLSGLLSVSDRGFGVYLLGSGELVISDSGIVSYNLTSHEIRLNQEGVDRIKGLDLAQKRFVAKLDGRAIYDGAFWSYIYSVPYSGVAIIDILAVQYGSTDTIRVDPCYPPQLCQGLDPRSNQELFNHFEEAGKLIQ